MYVGCSACPSHSDCAAAGKLTLTRLALGSTLPSALRVGVQPRFLPQSVMPQVGGWSSASETHHGTGDTPVRRDVTAGPPHCTSDRGALDVLALALLIFPHALRKTDMKDDSCGSCRDVIDDYSTMQQAIWSVGRPITLTIEGGPDIKSVYTGCCGNARRVGHDISPRWNSMTSLIDVGSGLWPFAHNGSKSANGSNPGGFWNDLDMIEVGNGAFVAETSELGAAQARSHYTMWAAMKAVMLLGCDLTRVGSDTLAILRQADVVAVNQDSLGVQARRLASIRPKNTSLVEGDHAVALLSPCDSSNPLQRWRYRAPPASPAMNELWIAPCNATDAAQQLKLTSGELRSVATGLCLNEAASSGYKAKFTECVHPAPAGQSVALDPGSGHMVVDAHPCLDCFNNAGPNVFIGSCKAPGEQDANQVFRGDPRYPGAFLSALSNSQRIKGDQCLTVRPPKAGGLLTTTTASDETWCLGSTGPQGEFSGAKCDPATIQPVPSKSWSLNLTDPSSTFVAALLNGAGGYTGRPIQVSNTGRNQFGASGPIPHARWSSSGGGGFWFDMNATGGSSFRSSNAHSILNDDNTGNVTVGGASIRFCTLKFPPPPPIRTRTIHLWVKQSTRALALAHPMQLRPSHNVLSLSISYRGILPRSRWLPPPTRQVTSVSSCLPVEPWKFGSGHYQAGAGWQSCSIGRRQPMTSHSILPSSAPPMTGPTKVAVWSMSPPPPRSTSTRCGPSKTCRASRIRSRWPWVRTTWRFWSSLRSKNEHDPVSHVAS